MVFNGVWFHFFMATALLMFSFETFAGPQTFAISGQIITPANEPLEASSVDFEISILSPAPKSCVLYREQFTGLNMTNSKGLFSLPVGSGTRSGADFEDASVLKDILNNSSGSFTVTSCSSAPNTYTPLAQDNRSVQITFNDGTGPVTVTQPLTLGASPYAMSADRIGSATESDILVRNISSSALTQAALESIFQTGQDALDLRGLLDGSSSDYVSSSPAATVTFNNQRVSNVGTPTAAADATNKNYVDSRLGGQTLNPGVLGAGDTGKVLTWSGTEWVSQPSNLGTAALQDGNTFGAKFTLGTNDAQSLAFETGGTERVTIDPTGGVAIANGLGVTGGTQLGGSVGIGIAPTTAKLTVAGSIITDGSKLNATTTVDFSTGNIQHSSLDCSSFQLNNLKDGGTYTFIVKGIVPALCTFTAYSDAGTTALTVHLPPDHSTTAAGKHTLYTSVVSGSDLYMSWIPEL